jgi:hypothetical protein
MARYATLLALCLASCAAPLTHGQPVEIVPQGHWQISGAAGVSASTGIVDVVDLAKNQASTLAKQQLGCKAADRSDCAKLTQVRDLERAFYTAGLGGLIDPVAELSVHYGLLPWMDVGGRVSGGAQRLDLDWQLVDGGADHQGWMALASLSYSHQTASVPVAPVQTILKNLGLDDTGRHNLDFALATGKRLGDIGWLTFGARYLVGRYTIDLRPKVPVLDDVFANAIVDAIPKTDESGLSHHVGGFAHVLLGYKHVFAGLELTGTYFFADATLLGKKEHFSGFAIQPAVTVVTRF